VDRAHSDGEGSILTRLERSNQMRSSCSAASQSTMG